MTPKIDKPSPPPNTPTRADASAITAGQRDVTRGYSAITNNLASDLFQRKATTAKTRTTGGTV